MTKRPVTMECCRPIDAHLFFDGNEDAATDELLMQIATRTCYLHATLADALDSGCRIS